MPIFKPQTFKEKFAESRRLGRKTFTWKGKKYHTRTKEEVESGKPNPNKPRGKDDPMHGPHPDRSMRRGGGLGSLIYQSGRETGTAGQPDEQQVSNDEAAQRREMVQYQANQGGRPGGSMRDVEQGPGGPPPGREVGRGSIPPNMQQQAMNQIAQYQQQLHAQKQQQFQMLLQELQVKNQQLEQQNQLLNTKIQKDDMINNARKIPSNLQKAITSPKKRGGSNSKKMGGAILKKGGSCGLPGGRGDMIKRRRR